MLCPNCNSEVSEARFCENCGAALAAETVEQLEEKPAEPTAQPVEQPVKQPAEQPVAQPVEQPTAQFQQPAGQAPQQGAYDPIPAATPTTKPAGPEPSAAPFVLAIIALVTAILGMFPVSIILAIIALVMNSGQKKRGEFSTKQTPTFVMSLISLILSIIVALIIALVVGIIGVAAVNGDFDEIRVNGSTVAINSSSSSATASNSAGSSSAKSGAKIADADDLVGSWRLTSLVEGGEEVNAASISEMQKLGLEVSLDLNSDHSATLTLFGVEMTGSWEASTPYIVTLSLEGEKILCEVDTETAELTLTEGDDEITFAKA